MNGGNILLTYGNIDIYKITSLILLVLLMCFIINNFRLRKKRPKMIETKRSLEELIKAHNVLEEKALKLENIIKYSDDAIISKNKEGYIIGWNKGAENIFGWSKKEIVGKHISLLYTNKTEHELKEIADNIKMGVRVVNHKTERLKKNGDKIFISLTVSPVRDPNGLITGTASISKDITANVINERKLQSNYEELSAVYSQLAAAEEELRAQYDELLCRERELQNSEERYKMALEVANNAIVEWDIVNDEYFISYKWRSLFNIYDSFETKGNFLNKLKTVVHKDDMIKILKAYRAHSKDEEKLLEVEFRLNDGEGKFKWIYFKGKILRDDNRKPTKFIGSLTDISARVEYKERIEYLANYDHLTGLPNKGSFFNSLERDIKISKENSGKGALIAIDLDEFKLINDTAGHSVGDQVLIEIAERLKDITDNEYLVSRTGGDEYLILIDKYDNVNGINALCREIVENIEKPINIYGEDIYTGGSVGIALYPDDGLDVDTLYKNVDTALYQSKKSGKSKFTFFDKKLGENMIRRDKIEKGLREAIENNNLQLHYQPKINVKSGKIYGFEGLLRWNSAELGRVSPLEFIEVAEERGLIECIGKWVIEEGARQNREWKNKGYDYENISVNLSPRQLKGKNLLEFIEGVIQKHGVDSYCFELEITENSLMEDFDHNVEILRKIKGNKVGISLDDFGTGYSSLSYLKELPINTLKIDKSFIDDIENNTRRKSIVDGIVQLAHRIDLTVVAEGVENERQVEILKQLECDVVQGYYYSRPLPPKEIEEKYFEIKSK